VVRWGFRKTALCGCALTIVSFTGLLICAITNAPHWVLTSVLLVSGLGFGPASMAYLLAAQDDVTWQQRGIVTSSIQFFRTIGGAVGIGVLGMLFNVLTVPQMHHLRESGINPAQLLDPHRRADLPPQVLQSASSAIAHGLTWVFAAMLISAAFQAIVTLIMPKRKSSHAVSRSEAIEAMAG